MLKLINSSCLPILILVMQPLWIKANLNTLNNLNTDSSLTPLTAEIEHKPFTCNHSHDEAPKKKTTTEANYELIDEDIEPLFGEDYYAPRGSIIDKLEPADQDVIQAIVELIDKRRLKPKIGHNILINRRANGKIEADRIISYFINGLLVVSGLYVCVFGFRVFRLLMILLGFYVSYYMILFITTEFQVYKANFVSHELSLFFSCLMLGFVIALFCYFFEIVNFLIFGTAVGSVIALFYAQFFVNLRETSDRNTLLVIHLCSSAIFSTTAFFVIDQTIIWGAAFVGAAITVINIGVIFGDFESFESRSVLPFDRYSDFKKYLLAALVLFAIGTYIQYYLRERVLKNFVVGKIDRLDESEFVEVES